MCTCKHLITDCCYHFTLRLSITTCDQWPGGVKCHHFSSSILWPPPSCCYGRSLTADHKPIVTIKCMKWWCNCCSTDDVIMMPLCIHNVIWMKRIISASLLQHVWYNWMLHALKACASGRLGISAFAISLIIVWLLKHLSVITSLSPAISTYMHVIVMN